MMDFLNMFYSKSNKQTMYHKTARMYLTSSNLKAIRKTDDFHYQIYFLKKNQKNDDFHFL